MNTTATLTSTLQLVSLLKCNAQELATQQWLSQLTLGKGALLFGNETGSANVNSSLQETGAEASHTRATMAQDTVLGHFTAISV